MVGPLFPTNVYVQWYANQRVGVFNGYLTSNRLGTVGSEVVVLPYTVKKRCFAPGDFWTVVSLKIEKVL